MTRWNRFFYQTQKDMMLWLFFMAFLSLFRAFFIFYFRSGMDASAGRIDVLWAMFYGLRFDAKIATFMALPSFLMSIATGVVNIERFADRFRTVAGSALAVMTTVACVVTIGYYREYHDQFNHFIVNLFYDDAKAIFTTVWNAYYPIANLAVIGLVGYAAIWIKNRFFDRGFVSRDSAARAHIAILARALIVLAVLVLLVIGIRGSYGRQPLRHRDAGITKDEFLNKAVLNPHIALFFALDEYFNYSGDVGLESYIPDRNVRRAAQAAFPARGALDSLDEYFKKHAHGPKNKPPRHVVLILMESYDSWPMLRRYDSLGVTNSLKEFARNGVSIENFLPASDSTMQSLSAILTSFPYASVEINYQPESRREYPSSLAGTFRRLGYRTRLFYGGFLSWQRIGDFAKAQGFNEVYGAPNISTWIYSNEWGVQDEQLFEFALGKMDDNTPSFNIILPTSHHAPYDMDVWAKGFPLKKIPDGIAPMVETDHAYMLKVLGHLWYSDKCIGDFVRSAEKKLKGALFAFTGDHYGRKFINARPDFFEKSSVPFVIYGREALRGVKPPSDVAGSHMDVGATLIELAAPKGFTYYSMGKNLLAERKGDIAIGWWRASGPGYIFDVTAEKFHQLNGRPLPRNLPDPKELKTAFLNYYGMGWWRVKRGSRL